jgi:hypothetical protein
MLRKVAPVCAALLLAVAVVVAAGQQALEVADIVITDQVMDREPGEHMTSVPADVGKVYCWMRITGADGETTIEHVWYKGDVEMARVPLTIAGSNWRTWSSKNIENIWTGDWRVDVVGPDGTVIRSVSFTVG